MTFERDIKWNTIAQKRITEKWLHDSWLKEQKILVQSEEEILKNMVEETFANGALNELNTEAMQAVGKISHEHIPNPLNLKF